MERQGLRSCVGGLLQLVLASGRLGRLGETLGRRAKREVTTEREAPERATRPAPGTTFPVGGVARVAMCTPARRKDGLCWPASCAHGQCARGLATFVPNGRASCASCAVPRPKSAVPTSVLSVCPKHARSLAADAEKGAPSTPMATKARMAPRILSLLLRKVPACCDPPPPVKAVQAPPFAPNGDLLCRAVL